jgi:RNA polymerase sigma factor (sigma-70 family)
MPARPRHFTDATASNYARWHDSQCTLLRLRLVCRPCAAARFLVPPVSVPPVSVLTPQMRAFARRMARGVFDPALDADDLRQTALLRLWRSAAHGGAAYVIARRAMIDEMRRVQGRRGSRRSRVRHYSLGMIEQHTRTPVRTSALAHDVRDAVAALPGVLRIIATAYYLDGRSAAECAVLIRRSERRVYQLCNRVRDIMRRRLAAYAPIAPCNRKNVTDSGMPPQMTTSCE